MSGMFSKLKCRYIERAEKIHDYVQLRFDDRAILNVYNRFSIDDNPNGDLSSLIGLMLTDTSSSDIAINLFLSGEKTFRIGMLDADYSGPEAMEYIASDGQRIVFP